MLEAINLYAVIEIWIDNNRKIISQNGFAIQHCFWRVHIKWSLAKLWVQFWQTAQLPFANLLLQHNKVSIQHSINFRSILTGPYFVVVVIFGFRLFVCCTLRDWYVHIKQSNLFLTRFLSATIFNILDKRSCLL